MFHTYDIAVIGGGMGGVAAALAAADAGLRVLLTEDCAWIGGQITSQGVSALDEHRYIEQFGGTRSYYALREAIRDDYRRRYPAVAATPHLNPGDGWVSHLCFEPQVGLRALDAMLAPHIAAGRITLLLHTIPVEAVLEGDTISGLTLRRLETGDLVQVQARYFLDATETGDLLPLTGAEYVVGAEARSDTGEADAAPDGPRPTEIQGFTFCFAIEHCPGEDHTIAKPADYELLRDRQPFTLTLHTREGEPRPFGMFADGPTGLPPFWTYRRLLSAELLDPGGATRDIAMINWNSNDYHHASIIDVPPDAQAHALDEGRRLSLAFLYWLQTEAPRDDGSGYGYPGLRLLPEVMGTPDGLSQKPYIRESRRILARKRIVAEELLAAGRQGARAESYPDSVGIGWYFMDLHPAVGNPNSMFAPTLPFQIPLGALIPQHLTNLLAACKNIGTTHLSNGSYRLHPVEWNIGESAGMLAAFCCTEGVTPADVWATAAAPGPTLLRRYQRQLLERGVPLAWILDVPLADPLFVQTQLLALCGAIVPESTRAQTLDIGPSTPFTGREAAAFCRALQQLIGRVIEIPPEWEQSPAQIATEAEWEQALGAADLSPEPGWAEVCAAYVP